MGAHRFLAIVLFASVTVTLASCGKNFLVPPANETGSEDGHEVNPGASTDSDGQKGARQIALDQATLLRYMKDNILEYKIDVPVGTVISIPADYLVQQANYRQADGTIAWSSTGYIQGVTIVSVPAKYAAGFPLAKIDELNQTEGGLYVFASIIGSIEGSGGAFDSIVPASPGAGFNKFYHPNGQPKFNFSMQIRKRWGDHVNRRVDPSSQNAAERSKWARIYAEIKMVADRTIQTPKSLLMIDKAEAVKRADAFEKSGSIPSSGAWTIAVQVTAPRHGFAPTPCAEFMSEIIREAYKRAGFDVTADFNSKKGNRLLWSDSAAVIKFSAALDRAGWVPWDASQFRPPIGAVMMNDYGETPGHTYLAAGDDGRIIVDNGAPQGRDLRKTIDHTISIMFKQGVFFLPPGINPDPW